MASRMMLPLWLVAMPMGLSSTPRMVRVSLLQRMSDTRLKSAELCSGAAGQWADGTCWLGQGWQAAAAAGLAAANDFNARIGTYVPQFASQAMQSCDVQLNVTVLDSGSTAMHALEQLVLDVDLAPDVVVGPLRSSVSEAVALLLGVRDVPQVSYGSSSPTLSDTSLYPRFFRTFPSDASSAITICQLLSNQLDLARVGVFYSSDTYGQGYMNALKSECSVLGVDVQGWSYQIGTRQSIKAAMSKLEESAASVVVFVFLDTADLTMLIEAGLELYSLGKSKPRLLVLPEALDLNSLSSAARDVLHGSLALRSIGGTTANPRWASFAGQGWYDLNASAFNSLLPAPFHFNQSLFEPTFDASNSFFLRNLGTYEYDAMAAVGLLACQVAPSGALPADFGTQLWENATSSAFQFEGLSGVVRFDTRGDRDQLTSNIELYNVLQAADGSLSQSQVASYDGTRSVPWVWEGGSMSASGVLFNGGKVTPPRMVRVSFLQRMSDARLTSAELCNGNGGTWVAAAAAAAGSAAQAGTSRTAADGTCWLGQGWQAVTALGLAAANDFNARIGTYVPQFASQAMQSCDVRLSVSVLDSGSTASVMMGALTKQLLTPYPPDLVIGPPRSEVAQQTATLLGTEAIDTPQVSYWASSPKLSDKSLYPRFMRTYPTDQATAVALCDFWKTTMGFSNAAAIYLNDAFGEGFKESLLSACLQLGVNVQAFPYLSGDVATIESQIQRLASSNLRVVLVIALGHSDVAGIVDAALREGTTLGLGIPSWWFFNDFGGGFASLPQSTIQALHGSVQIKPTGALATNPRWAAFASHGWPSLSASTFSNLLPAPFHFNDTLFEPGFSESTYVRDVATYMYDAVAAIGLLTCQVTPSAALPADFGTQLWKAATTSAFQFEGLSGVVRFDKRGDRDQLTANIQIYNVLLAADGNLSESLVASYDGTRSVPWVWEGGSMSASGVLFNGGFQTPPQDLASSPSATIHIAFIIVACSLFGALLILVTVYLLAKYKKGKTAEAKRKKTEEELEKARADAQRERSLMAIIFHELRNPLNGVVAHLRLGSQSPGESAERLQSALVCTDHALSFLNGLSQIEKLEASAATTALRLEPCSLYEVAQSVITIVSPQLKSGVKMLTRYPPETLQVRLDRTVLAQILINLLQNAAANTSSGFVELVCSVMPNSTSETSVEVALIVRDSGNGMSEEMQAKVFDRYQSIGGIGLGMYLTKLQIQQMGSSISVQSPWSRPNGEEGGTQFSFSLHLELVSSSLKDTAPSRIHPTEAALPAPQLPRQLKVLIADDVKMNRKLLRAALSRHCCSEWQIDEVVTAEAAVADMSTTAGSRYDLVLMDDHFEVDGSSAMRGSEAISHIRAFELENPSLRPAVLIMCTGAALDSDAAWTKHGRHADAVWAKPFPDFTDNTMQRMLNELLHNRPDVTAHSSSAPTDRTAPET